MREFLSSRDSDEINRLSDAMRGKLGTLDTFYYIVETKEESETNPEDSVFGEPVDPFSLDTTSVTRRYVAFQGYITQNDNTNLYEPAGYLKKNTLSVEVSSTTETNLGLVWNLGQLVAWRGIDYRVSNTDCRGFIGANRIILILEKVT